jgi:hypothetical protein
MTTLTETAHDLLTSMEQQASTTYQQVSKTEMDDDMFCVAHLTSRGAHKWHYALIPTATQRPTYMTRPVALKTLEAFIKRAQHDAITEAMLVLMR